MGEMMYEIKEFLKARRKIIFIAAVLLAVSVTSSNCVMFDHTPYDGPKGFGFPFAFYIGQVHIEQDKRRFYTPDALDNHDCHLPDGCDCQKLINKTI